jgi:hypothetical protein
MVFFSDKNKLNPPIIQRAQIIFYFDQIALYLPVKQERTFAYNKENVRSGGNETGFKKREHLMY